jgi:EmrB/QacA subfamily drug resistance transporter
MTVHSHTPTSLLKRIKAMHHGTAATTTTTTTLAMTPSHHHDHRSSNPTPAAGHSRAVLLGVLLVAQLMVILDITAVNIALPSLAADLQLSGSTVSWTITSYSLVFGSLLLFGGRLSDLVGRRRMFLTGLGIFTVSSVASAVAGTAAALFAARAGQGLGAALLSPAALSIITNAFHGKHRAKALAAWGAVGGAGAAIGVLVGGVLTEVGDWRLIFFVNIPVAIGLAVAALHVIPRDEAKPRWRGLDVPGALLGTASIATLVYAITQADQAGWGSTQTIGLATIGVLGLAAFAAWEHQTENPLLRVERIADPAVGGGLLLMLVAAGSIFGLFLLSSLYLQNVLGTNPLMTGLAFIPLALAAGAGAHAAGHVVSRHGVRTPLVAAFLIAAAGMALLAHVSENGTYLRNVLPGMLVAGFGLGIAVVSVSISVMTGTREDESGMISGLNSTGHEIGGTIGIAVFSTIAAGATGALGGAHAASGISHAFVAAGAITALASLAAYLVLPHARDFVPKLRLNPQSMPIH